MKRAWPLIEPGVPYLHNWHIDAVAEHLEAVSSGELRRLVVNMPPRYGKSIMVSVMWPVWEWTTRPETRWMFASYSGSLSTKHSLDRRAILQSEWYRERWGDIVRLAPDHNQKAEFSNSRRGAMVATSFGGTATGKGGNRLVIDDPHSPEDVLSDVRRRRTIRFFDQTLGNRLDDKKQGAIVIVMQRLHEADLSARCLELGYTHLCLPAVSRGKTTIRLPSGRSHSRADGELLWPEREGAAQIEEARRTLGSYGFAGQYEQAPTPFGGGIFRASWFTVVDAIPADPRTAMVRYWDKAGTQGGGAYTAGVLMARTPDGLYFVLDVVRGQWSAGEREKRIRQTAERDGRHVAIWVEQEPGSGGKESAQNTIINLAGWNARAEPVTGDKVSRSRPFAAQAEAGNIRLLRDTAPRRWNADFLDELTIFPAGPYKDQVDAAAGAFNKLALSARPVGAAVAMERVATLNPLLLQPSLWGRF